MASSLGRGSRFTLQNTAKKGGDKSLRQKPCLHLTPPCHLTHIILAKSPTQVQGVVNRFFLFTGNLPMHHALTIHTIDLSVSNALYSFLPKKQRHFYLTLALLTGSHRAFSSTMSHRDYTVPDFLCFDMESISPDFSAIGKYPPFI